MFKHGLCFTGWPMTKKKKTSLLRSWGEREIVLKRITKAPYSILNLNKTVIPLLWCSPMNLFEEVIERVESFISDTNARLEILEEGLTAERQTLMARVLTSDKDYREACSLLILGLPRKGIDMQWRNMNIHSFSCLPMTAIIVT